MAGSSGRGGLGWVILVIALAVPGVLFYNWWSHLKADREKTIAAKTHNRLPEGGVFQSSPNAKLVNPMAPVVSTAPPAAVVAAPVPAAPAAVGATPVVAATTPAPVVSAASAAASSNPTFANSASTTTALPLKRDPMLSPFDQVRILEEEEAKRKAAEDLANAKRPGKKRAAPAYNPVKDIDLQGIVSNAETGYQAIVNGDMVGVGATVGKGIRIVRITDNGVVFDFHGKRFTKSLSQ